MRRTWGGKTNLKTQNIQSTIVPLLFFKWMCVQSDPSDQQPEKNEILQVQMP